MTPWVCPGHGFLLVGFSGLRSCISDRPSTEKKVQAASGEAVFSGTHIKLKALSLTEEGSSDFPDNTCLPSFKPQWKGVLSVIPPRNTHCWGRYPSVGTKERAACFFLPVFSASLQLPLMYLTAKLTCLEYCFCHCHHSAQEFAMVPYGLWPSAYCLTFWDLNVLICIERRGRLEG